MERRSNYKYGTLQDRKDLEPSLQRKIFENSVAHYLNSHEVFITKYLARDAVSTGPLACGHLTWPSGHPDFHSTDPDWSPKLKDPF